MEGKIRYSDSDINFALLTESDFKSIADFSCGTLEIDEVFHDEIELCSKYHYLSPYKCFHKTTNEIIGLFTLANDVLRLEYEEQQDFPGLNLEYKNVFSRQPTYPAVNIGHLAVKESLQRRGIGSIIVDFIINTFYYYRLSGCQFITVDALNNSKTLNFYQDKMGFEFQTVCDIGKHTRRMYKALIV